MPSSVFTFCLATVVFFSTAAHAMQAGHNSEEEEKKYREHQERIIGGLSPEQYVAVMNSGWRSEYDSLRARLDEHKNYLVIHALEPSLPMDMRTADKLRRSLIAGGIAQMAGVDVGHVWVGWRCQAEAGGRPIEGIAGMTGEHSNQFSTMLKAGWGLSPFLAIFTDGHLTPPELAEIDHKAFDGTAPIHTLVVEVSQAVCDQARAYVHDFITLPNAPHKRFGLAANPRKLEGGGCGTFGAAFLEASGVFAGTSLDENLWRKVQANKRVFGFGLPLPPFTDDPFNGRTKGTRKVSLLSIGLSSWNPRQGEKGFSLNIMDPELFLLSLKTVYRLGLDEIKSQNGAGAQSFVNSNLFKYRGLKARKNGPVRAYIDRRFDPKAAAVVSDVHRWYKTGGFRPSLFTVDKAPVVLLERP